MEGEISHIEIPRLTANLGITIVGGADTALVSEILSILYPFKDLYISVKYIVRL